jgi:hypothetical protein
MSLPELLGAMAMGVGLALAVLGFIALCLSVYVMVREDGEHWPALDDEPRLDVQNHIGDSRPIR